MVRTRVLASGLLVWLVLAVVSSAEAGEVMFSIRDGRVTLVARDAPIGDILAIWEKEGRTKIVAREKVRGTIASLDLVNEPEASALAIVLRSVSGYLAVKNAVEPADASIYRCIVINPAPAPALALQSVPASRPVSQPNAQNGMGGMPMGDPGVYPPSGVPALPDDADDNGMATRTPMPPGMRAPGAMPLGGLNRPPSDGASIVDPAGRPTPPTGTPGYPTGGAAVPGAVVAPPKPPGTPTPGQKPPGQP